jgi:AraC-like DNA-binding protein
VAAIADQWGLMQLGRVAAAYKAVVGQTPLQTLRAAA